MYVAFKEHLAKFNVLSRVEIEEVIDNAIERNYKKGEYFIQASRPNTELFYLLSGVFRYYNISNSGIEDTLMFLTEGEFFAELKSFHEEGLAEGSLQAETDAKILVFSRRTYMRLSSKIPGLDLIFRRTSQDKLTKELMLSRGFVRLEAKDAYLLLLKHYPDIVSQVPDKHLAAYMGITKHSLSRIKKKIMGTPH